MLSGWRSAVSGGAKRRPDSVGISIRAGCGQGSARIRAGAVGCEAPPFGGINSATSRLSRDQQSAVCKYFCKGPGIFWENPDKQIKSYGNWIREFGNT